MILTYSKTHRTDKYSQHISIILVSFAKWLIVPLRTKWLWVRISLLSLKLEIWHLLRTRSCLTFNQTVVRGFTLKLVRDMIITYSQIHRADKYSQHSSIIFPVCLNGSVFLIVQSGCEFEHRCFLLSFRYCTCNEEGVPRHSGKL